MGSQKVLVVDARFQPLDRSGKASAVAPRRARGEWRSGWQRFTQNRGAVLFLGVLLVLIAMALIGPHMNGYSYDETNYGASYHRPGAQFWLGTDSFGRDQWTRLWQGTRISLFIGVLAAVLDLVIGVTFGAVSAYLGGKTDLVMQRVIDVLVGIPNLIVVILLILVLTPGITTIVIAMTITGWVGMARLARSEVFKLKELDYVLAAKGLGASTSRIIFIHFVPNMAGLIIINMMFTIPHAIFTEAFLSFIGLGLQEPGASLGVLINTGYHSMQSNSYLLVYPALVIVALMVCFNVIADGLRDVLDPKMRV